ncbi:conserved hypothetical protein [Gammaproteobacteria bacterium]
MKLKPKRVVYTAVFGNYDQVPPVNPKWDCDFICFTDNPENVSSGWQVVMVKLNGEQPAQANRRYKMLPHKYLLNYECSLYVDGNIRIVSDPSPLFRKYLDSGVIAMPKHQDRKCVYEEARVCIEGGRVDKKITEQQMSRYLANGFPEKYGMTENGIIFRRHHDINLIAMMTSWWEEYCNGGRRDQLSLSYLIWKYQIDVLEVIEGVRINKKFFEIDLHVNDKSKSFIIRLARKANQNKHLNYYYFIISKIVSLAIIIRNKFLPYNHI